MTSITQRNYWVVNQGKTFTDEFEGGYLWAPITNKAGHQNTYYTNVTKVKKGDVIFSFVKGKLVAINTCEEEFVDCKNPLTNHKEDWISDGWKIIVKFTKIDQPLLIKTYIDRIRPHLPSKYSPLLQNGNAPQSGYLHAICSDLANILMELAGKQIDEVTINDDIIEDGIRGRTDITATQVTRIVNSRRGQGQYRQNVYENEKSCRVTGVSDLRFLNASHIKPWRSCSDIEKLDGCNGLLLSLNVDRAFDKGLISFTDSGDILHSSKVDTNTLRSIGIEVSKNVGRFNKKQCEYMEYHRRNVFMP
jgi:hypothetical protein